MAEFEVLNGRVGSVIADGHAQLSESRVACLHGTPRAKVAMRFALHGELPDASVESARAELLRGVCDMLDCPMPPLLPGGPAVFAHDSVTA